MNQFNPLDTQVGGSHYKGVKLQPLEFSEKYQLTPSEFSIIRYITRWRKKNGMEDLEKIEHYLDLLLYFAENDIVPMFPEGLELPPVKEFLDQFPELTEIERSLATEVVTWRYPAGPGVPKTPGLRMALALMPKVIQIGNEFLKEKES